MTEYALSPTTDSTPQLVDVAAMLAANELRAYRVRSNGTMRHLDLLPLGSTKRETAEWISDAVDFDGRSVDSVAREMHVSAPTVRRYLESLELTEEIEAGEWDGIWTAAGEVAELAEDTTDQIMNLLDNPPTVGDLIDATSNGTDVAPVVPPARRTRTPRAKAPVDQADVLARNRALFTSTPQPTDEQRAAALADVPGARCEPTGTTADELAATLAASLPAPAPRARVRSTDLHVCFCNSMGAHAPGAPNCASVAVPRRVRTHG